MSVNVQYDQYPYENRWKLMQMPDGDVVFNTNFNQFWVGNAYIETPILNLAPGDYVLTIEDNAVEEDGMCCQYGNGFVQVTNLLTGEILVDFDGVFGSYVDLAFSLGT